MDFRDKNYYVLLYHGVQVLNPINKLGHTRATATRHSPQNNNHNEPSHDEERRCGTTCSELGAWYSDLPPRGEILCVPIWWNKNHDFVLPLSLLYVQCYDYWWWHVTCATRMMAETACSLWSHHTTFWILRHIIQSIFPQVINNIYKIPDNRTMSAESYNIHDLQGNKVGSLPGCVVPEMS